MGIVAETVKTLYMNNDDVRDNIRQKPQNNLDLEIQGSDLSYLLFTSGTTGMRKVLWCPIQI
jgi:acyl-coenzyme A synthetase/AMP-(fatty) acid ligase